MRESLHPGFVAEILVMSKVFFRDKLRQLYDELLFVSLNERVPGHKVFPLPFRKAQDYFIH